MKQITREQLKEMMDKGEQFVLIDARLAEAYQMHHLPGAASLPLEQIDEANARFKKEDSIVVYCGSFECPVSHKAGHRLEELGFTNILHFAGGLKDWLEAGYRTESSAKAGAEHRHG